MKYPLLCCILFISLALTAQDKNRVFGKVTFKKTGAVIPNASVFISGSSLGTTTDSAGNFELKGIIPGNFQLIISSIGYNTIAYPFSSDQLPLKLDVQMDLKVEVLDEVTVEPFDPNGLNKYGVIFLEMFIGTAEGSRSCHITNMKALRFRYNQKKKLLTVVADEPLIIKNDYLGYTIKYQLEEFNYNMADRTIFFYGYSFFTDNLEKRDRIPVRFAHRRRQTYNGSMTHFMHSLYYDRLKEEGFEVRRLVTEPNYEKDRVRKIMESERRNNISSGGVTVMKLGIPQPADSLAYFRRVMQQSNEIKRVGAALLTADSLLTPGKDSKNMVFPNFLQIVYVNEFEENGYLTNTMQPRKPGFQVSEIFLTDESGVNIYPNGYFYPPHNIFSLLYWAWSEKMSHLLPLDYEPR